MRTYGVMLGLLASLACGEADSPPPGDGSDLGLPWRTSGNPSVEDERSPVGPGSPAALYCVDLGYALSTVTTQGGEDSWCTFPDGTGCLAWSFYRGTCGQPFTYCETHGGQVSNQLEDMGGWMGELAVCTFPSGASCKEDDLWRAGTGVCP